ncbi:MAG: adenylosuccinate lyase [Saprospiraceae bacterium]|nr:adenylosuccinate lyase [Saprospiraceae bacterium]
MKIKMIKAISPIDGRYFKVTEKLGDYFSEYGLIKYRVFIEIEYFKALIAINLPQLKDVPADINGQLDSIFIHFNNVEADKIKHIEKTTNHDVKAIEYYIKEQFEKIGLNKYKEFIHFGLTSQDINSTAFPLMIKDAIHDIILPALNIVIEDISKKAEDYKGIPMLARTHGQPASPTTLGKEMSVFVERLTDELQLFKSIRFKCKFGGATGNFNAHKVSYNDIDWPEFADNFTNKLGLYRSKYTTQIAHYDDLAAIFHSWARINTILIDFCRDIWSYISIEYFKQKVKEGEIGSSAMPHKVNPIDFENAEGNLGLANSIFYHLAEKLPVSRLQRDLTDSTVLRNVGIPFAHSLIAFNSIHKGIDKLLLNQNKLNQDLNNNWAVVAEAIQNILRREMYREPYEALKNLTRGKSSITESDIHQFISELEISAEIKNELMEITPLNYIGYY